MTDLKAPKLSKWPFFASDIVVLLVAGFIVHLSLHPLGTWPAIVIAALAATGAWVAVTPFLVEYRAALKVAEADALTTVVEQMNDLRTLANQISFATAQWQVVQDQASQTVKAAHEIAASTAQEAQAFGEFMQKANDAEKGHLRLEVEKLHRSEGEWLESSIRMLDHVYALHQAGLRSGQEVLIKQLGQFQNACREAMRRVGLTAFEAEKDEPFDEKAHQLMNRDGKLPNNARVAETLASGYRYQGRVLRLPLVAVAAPAAPSEDSDSEQQQIEFPTPAPSDTTDQGS